MRYRLNISPFALPIIFFGAVILAGTFLLHHPASTRNGIGWIDALFTATSATCVTGLVVVDTGSFFTRFGQTVILCLIQVGGLGIMTFTGLTFYLLRHRVSLSDRLAVGQSLLHDPTFHLGRFLLGIVAWTFAIEAVGALFLFIQAPAAFNPYSAIFHAISAFCNAGFSLSADSLMVWRSSWGVNLVIMMLIFLGGIGFSVLVEMLSPFFHPRLLSSTNKNLRLSWYSKLVLKTSIFLIVAGWLGIFGAEFIGVHRGVPFGEALLSSLFQSVTSRTAGFNTLDIGQLTNVSLILIMLLMLIGGAPGSCAGGVKVTTFRAVVAFAVAHLKGKRQAAVGKFAISRESMNKAMTLVVFAVIIISTVTLLLNITEGGELPHPEARGLFLEIMFEVVSAFGTVGLSTGITPKLTAFGRCLIIATMFIGRLGPIVFLAALQSYQREQLYNIPEENILIG